MNNLSGKQLVTDFSPLFSTIKEYQELEALIDFVIGVNKIMSQLNNLFTMQSFFGTSIIDFYEQNLSSGIYSNRIELLNTKVNFQKVKISLKQAQNQE